LREYDLIAGWYASDRGNTTGVPEVVALAASLPAGSRVLDIGCGNGLPLTRALLEARHRVLGLDSSPEMLARFRRNLPNASALRATVESCPFRDAVFDGAIAWGVLFHLPLDAQRKAIASVSRVLRDGAPFLFTAGDVDEGGTGRVGTMHGVEFRYYSLTVDAYRRVLADHRFSLVDFHRDAGDNRYYLARKTG
jgi:SAM-dependent methyltransferase